MPAEDLPRPCQGSLSGALVVNTALVPIGSPAPASAALDNPNRQTCTSSPIPEGATSTVEEPETDGVSALRNSFRQYQVSANVADILMASWRSGTQKQYKVYLEIWMDFCRQRKTNYYSPEISDALDFLMSLYSKGLSYSTINTARSALSTILNIQGCTTFGSHPLVIRFLKGIFEKRKPQPKYDTIWDASKVLNFLGTLWPVQELTLKDLTLKLLMLLLLVTGQRGQSIHLLNPEGMNLTESSCRFQLLEHIKTSKPGQSSNIIEITEFKPDPKICP